MGHHRRRRRRAVGRATVRRRVARAALLRPLAASRLSPPAPCSGPTTRPRRPRLVVRRHHGRHADPPAGLLPRLRGERPHLHRRRSAYFVATDGDPGGPSPTGRLGIYSTDGTPGGTRLERPRPASRNSPSTPATSTTPPAPPTSRIGAAVPPQRGQRARLRPRPTYARRRRGPLPAHFAGGHPAVQRCDARHLQPHLADRRHAGRHPPTSRTSRSRRTARPPYAAAAFQRPDHPARREPAPPVRPEHRRRRRADRGAPVVERRDRRQRRVLHRLRFQRPAPGGAVADGRDGDWNAARQVALATTAVQPPRSEADKLTAVGNRPRSAADRSRAGSCGAATAPRTARW